VPTVITYAVVVAAAALVAWLIVRNRRLIGENTAMRARMSEVQQMKKNFISHVSHELKAPLASMQETTHLILERIPGPLTEKQQRLLELNLQSGKRLAQMIGNMLDLSRLEAGIVEYEMQRSDIADLMHNVVIEVSNQAREKSLRLLTDIQREPLIIECDPNRMVQLFTNLLENALRFSAKGGSVGVNVRQVHQLPRMPQSARDRIARDNVDNGFALISISDSGPGIEDSHKEEVFHTFHQVKHGKKSLGESLGLGLAISRAVVEAHSGTIWVQDNPAGGAIFFVLLPRAAAGSLAQAS
jgi:two-component system, NtrC family, sensor histidine kinase GlrK